MPVPTLRLRGLTALAIVSLLAACASPREEAADAPAGAAFRTTGTVVAVDTGPWAYDGNAVVQVDTQAGRVAVQLPARWNLCQAQAVDVDALGVGTRVEVVGEQIAGREIVVCADPSHRLAPLPPGG